MLRVLVVAGHRGLMRGAETRREVTEETPAWFAASKLYIPRIDIKTSFASPNGEP
jgi:hypothetical protein